VPRLRARRGHVVGGLACAPLAWFLREGRLRK
jgi:hypothetical protein